MLNLPPTASSTCPPLRSLFHMTAPKICEGYRASLCLCLPESLTWQSQALCSAKEERVHSCGGGRWWFWGPANIWTTGELADHMQPSLQLSEPSWLGGFCSSQLHAVLLASLLP